MDELSKRANELLKDQRFDFLGMGVIDFKQNAFDCFEIEKGKAPTSETELVFDLASLTKPLTLSSVYFSRPDLFETNELLLLDHRAGLPAWGLVSKKGWEKQILSYSIKESETVYSDFSALRLMLELEKSSKKPLRDLCSYFWDEDLRPWYEIENKGLCPPTGTREGHEIKGVVNDDKAYMIGGFCSHAGLFSSVDVLCQTLLNLDEKVDLLEKMLSEYCKHEKNQRFLKGWDTVSDPTNTLAGPGCSFNTFGHLGFTGTSIWIDAQKRIGHVILTNATQRYAHSREGLNKLRRELGQWVWKHF